MSCILNIYIYRHVRAHKHAHVDEHTHTLKMFAYLLMLGDIVFCSFLISLWPPFIVLMMLAVLNSDIFGSPL